MTDADTANRKVMAGVEDISRQNKWNRLVAGEHGEAFKTISVLGSVAEMAFEIPQVHAAIVFRSTELYGPALRIEHGGCAALHAKHLSVRPARQQHCHE